LSAGVATREYVARHNIVDDDDGRGRPVVLIVKETPALKWNLHGMEKPGCDDSKCGSGGLVLRRLRSRTGPVFVLAITFAERHMRGNGGRLDTGNPVDAIEHLTVSEANARGAIHNFGGERDLGGEDAARVEPGMNPQKTPDTLHDQSRARQENYRQSDLDGDEDTELHTERSWGLSMRPMMLRRTEPNTRFTAPMPKLAEVPRARNRNAESYTASTPSIPTEAAASFVT